MPTLVAGLLTDLLVSGIVSLMNLDNPHDNGEYVPFEEGHCVFYAAQAALLYFHGQGLSLSDREQISTDLNWHKQERAGKVYELTIEYLAELLSSKGLKVVFNSPDNLESVPYNGQVGVPEIPFPALIFTYSPDAGHVWFAQNLDCFQAFYTDEVADHLLAATASVHHPVQQAA